MSILQFLRVLWAGRFIILITTVVCFTAAVAVVEFVPPSYQADSRVMLDVIKPDPVTGQVMATAFLRAYTKTQIELLQGQNVASKVVEDLGWAKDKHIQKLYKNRKSGDDRSFEQWAVQRVIDGTNASVIDGSNILDITFKDEDPDTARRAADSLSKAYMATTLETRQDAAKRNADWYEAQAEKAKQALFAAETTKSAFERQNGVLLQDDKVDIDSARLQALAQAAAGPTIAAPMQQGVSPTQMQLTQLDADIAQAAKTLGPNHPQIIDMKRRREVLASQVKQELSASSSSAQASLGAARATAQLLDEQKAKVMGQRDKIEQLRLMQDNVDIRRDEYNKATARAAQLRQEAQVAATEVTALGSAVTPQAPVFPNRPLMLAGGFIGGLGFGVVMALGKELIGRRVRGPEDLRAAIDVPIIAIVANPDARRGGGGRGWFRRKRGLDGGAAAHA